MEPIMAIWDGFSLDGASVASGALSPYIEQARQQVRYRRRMNPNSTLTPRLRLSLWLVLQARLEVLCELRWAIQNPSS